MHYPREATDRIADKAASDPLGVGSLILYWEPQETPATRGTYNWSGPHRISEHNIDRTGYKNTFYHERRRVTVATRANRIVAFEPYSEQ